jgi:hypothetical protein
MRAALATQIVPWWSGPSFYSSSTTNNYGIVLLGVTTPEAIPSFCGYEGSRNVLKYATLAAARDWHLRAALEAGCTRAIPDEATRELFTEHWLSSHSCWHQSFSWSFVRERAVAMAGTFGTPALVPHLRAYLEPSKAEDKSTVRTRAHACTALAALTGADRRFDFKGAPRGIDEVAKEYREQLDRK